MKSDCFILSSTLVSVLISSHMQCLDTSYTNTCIYLQLHQQDSFICQTYDRLTFTWTNKCEKLLNNKKCKSHVYLAPLTLLTLYLIGWMCYYSFVLIVPLTLLTLYLTGWMCYYSFVLIELYTIY